MIKDLIFCIFAGLREAKMEWKRKARDRRMRDIWRKYPHSDDLPF